MDSASKIVPKSRAVFGVRLKAVLTDWAYVANNTQMESSARRRVDTATMAMELGGVIDSLWLVTTSLN